MSLDELRDQGILLPEEEWGEHSLKTTVARGPLLLVLVLAVIGLVAAFLGDGAWPTWVGVGLFLVALYCATILCDRAVERQRERMKRRQTPSATA